MTKGDKSYVGEILIPQTILNEGIEYKIASIGNSAFEDSEINKIALPNSIVEIEEAAFSHCLNLESIKLPKSIQIIQDDAFRYCSQLTDIVIPENVILIGKHAFYGCSNLHSFIMNGSVELGNGVLEDCGELRYIELPSTLQVLGEHAFRYCYKVEQIVCHAIRPPKIDDSGTFRDIEKYISIFVPEESISYYQIAYGWSEFIYFKPINKQEDIIECNIEFRNKDNTTLTKNQIELSLPYPEEIEGFTFLKWKVLEGDLEEGIKVQAIYIEDPLSIHSIIIDNQTNSARKILKDGQIFIIKKDRIYNLEGKEVK